MDKKPVTVQDFSKDLPQTYDDGRLNAPAFHRNQEAIRTCLRQELVGRNGHALEVGSGTGQHVIVFAEDHPSVTWWPSDLNDNHLTSIDAWRLAEGGENIMPPFALDASGSDWGFGETGRPPGDGLDLIISLNVIHISPWIVSEGLFHGANRYLRDDGMLMLYGPFSFDGKHSAPSNQKFDESLRSRNPEWGVRDMSDLTELAEPLGFSQVKRVAMPANNFVLIFRRR